MVAGLESDANESTCDRVDLAEECLHGDTTPCADVGAAFNRDLPGVSCYTLVEHLGQVHILGGFSRCDGLP